MRYITVRECFEKLSISEESGINSITIREADELETFIYKEKLKVENFVWGRRSLTFINYVGVIQLSTVCIEILPKIDLDTDIETSRKRLLEMLVKGKLIKINYSDISNVKNYKVNLNELMGLIFANMLQKELLKGVYGEYVSIKDNIGTLKGKLIFKKQIKNISTLNPKAHCEFEEFSIDNKLNQIFKFVVKILLNNLKNRETLKTLRHIYFMLEEISDISYKKVSNTIIYFNRLNNRFSGSYNIANNILNGLSSIGNTGNDRNFSLLFEMNVLFEKYISNILEGIIGDKTMYRQHSKYKLLINEETSKGIFKLIPDIVIEENKQYKLIIDTKWKRLDFEKHKYSVKREDLYQMYSYLTRYKEVSEVILLYPKNSESKIYSRWSLEENKSKVISMFTVNLRNEDTVKNDLLEILK